MWDIQQRKLTYLGFCPKDKTPPKQRFHALFVPSPPPPLPSSQASFTRYHGPPPTTCIFILLSQAQCFYFQILWFLKIGKLFQNFSKSTLVFLILFYYYFIYFILFFPSYAKVKKTFVTPQKKKRKKKDGEDSQRLYLT